MVTSPFKCALIAACFSQAITVSLWGQQDVPSDAFRDLYAQIYSADLSELPQIQGRLGDFGDRELSNTERLRLHAAFASRYRDTNPELAVNTARKVLNNPVFDANEIVPQAASSWASAAETYLWAARPEDRRALVESTEKKFVNSKQSACLRLVQLDMLLRWHARLGTSRRGRRLAEEQLPGVLQALSITPEWLTLRSLWQLDSSLAAARVPSDLRLRSLSAGSTAVERVMKQADFHLNQFSNLWHFRLTAARILSEKRADESAVLRMLADVEEYRDLQVQAIKAGSEHPGPAIAKNASFHQRNVEKIRALARQGKTPDTNGLVGTQVPDFALTYLDGRAVSIAELRGRVVVIDFWAVWCGPCIRAFPDLAELDEMFDEDSVLLIGITKQHGYRWNEADNQIQDHSDASRAEEIDAIRQFVASHNLKFPQVLDDGEIVDRFSVSSWPTTVVIDQEGVVRFSGSIAKKTQFERLVDEIESLLKK